MWGAALLVTVCCSVAAASVARDQGPSPLHNSTAKAAHRAGQSRDDSGEIHHKHQDIYSKYLAPIKANSPHLLELGLGCSSNAAALRQRYPASATVSFVEADAACAKEHEANITASTLGKPYHGTVDNGTLLNSIRADSESFGGFDVIIVARGHSAEQMLASIKSLWHALKSGGIYIVEDISENYAEKPFGDKGTFVAFVKNAIDIVHCRTKPARTGLSSSVRREFKAFCAANPMDIVSVECQPEACVLAKGRATNASDEAERADSRAERMLESGGGAESLAAQLLARQEVAYRRLKIVAAHMPAFDLGWIVAVSALASVCASLGLYASAVWRQWRRDVYRAQFIRSRDTSPA
ncbi:hypothetical protein WJX81_004714 [Elliptochloris bilobata]|uniref:S-adenosyl-L-methionine-dependent methyltransferase n=1 Tax=Elliptochloris bilobata TaxID=381761 RepID=A0AAW1RR96_9CHLO